MVNELTQFVTRYGWAVKIAVLVLIGLAISLAGHLLFKIYLPRAYKKRQRWQNLLLQSLRGPLHGYIWIIIATYIVQIVLRHFNVNGNASQINDILRRMLTLVFLFWFVMRFIRRWEGHAIDQMNTGVSRRAFQDSTSVAAVSQLARVIAIVIILLMLLSSIGVSITTLLAFGGIGGLAISFAAKDTLANFIGGLMIYWDRPFSVGDWVRSPDRNIEGTVVNIGWRLTQIRTFNKRPLYVPNGVFSTISVENPSRMLNRRIKTLVGVRYEDSSKISAIVAGIKAMLESDPEIDTTQTLFVKLVEFGPSALNILIYTFTKTTEWVKFQEVQEQVFLKIIDIVSQQDAQIAYPTSVIHIPDGLEYFQPQGSESSNI